VTTKSQWNRLLAAAVALAFLLAGCFGTSGPSTVAQGRAQYRTGEPAYDEYFAAVYELQVALAKAPAEEQQVGQTLRGALGVDPAGSIDDAVARANQHAQALASAGTRLKVDLRGMGEPAPEVDVVPTGTPPDPAGQAFAGAIRDGVLAFAALHGRMRQTRAVIDRLQVMAPALEAQLDTVFRKSLARRTEVRKNFEDSKALIPIMIARAQTVEQSAGQAAVRLAEACRTDDGSDRVAAVLVPIPGQPGAAEAAPPATESAAAPVTEQPSAPAGAEEAAPPPAEAAAPPEPASPAEPAVPPPAATAPAPAQPPPAVQPPSGQSSATYDLQRGQLDAQFQRDCATNPNQEICQQQGAATIGPGGIQAGFSQETVTRVQDPPSGSVNFSLDGSFTYGKLSMAFPAIGGGSPSTIDSEFYGGGIALGVKILTGGKFPGPEGGSWFGLFIDPSVSISGAGGEITIPAMRIGTVTIPEQKQGYGMLLINGGAAVGFQWLTFGSMDPQTFKQGGFGLQAGYRLGAQGSQMYFENSSGDFTTDFSHGPVLGLTFPSYNAGTAHLSRAYVQGMILPAGDLLVITIAAGYAF
jgi:hypothetical protein